MRAAEVLKTSGVKGGLVVHLGCGGGAMTAALAKGEGFLVHGLDADPANVAKAREHIASLGLYGRVSVARSGGRSLPYVDNLVNLVVAEGLGDAAMGEVMRVLAPGGVAMVRAGGKWSRTVKPRPEDIDEWTHYLHGPDNNAVAHDRVVAVPFGVQWVAAPMWARHHNHLSSTSAMVSAGGRVFAIMDEGPAASLAQPPKWGLVARDAFSGVALWRRAVGPWEPVLRPFRSGPTELSRRLIAVGQRVYVTLGYGKAVVALDAATGRTVAEYPQTKGAEEIIRDGAALYVVVGASGARKADGGARRRAAAPARGPAAKRIVALDADTGRVLWSKGDADTGDLLPTTLCASGGRLFFQDPDGLVCLDAGSGKVLWRSARPVRRKRVAWSAPTVVVCDGVVLSADCAAPAGEAGPVTWTVTPKPKRGDAGAGELVAFSAADGRELWRCKAAQGYTSPADVFVVDGLVWAGASPDPSNVDFTEGRDLHTGEVKRRIDTSAAFESAHHHRCYRNKATDRFILLGRTGVEFIDLSGAGAQRHCWIRGACQYGVMPANGLIYLPPHSCGCYIQSKLSGFWAVAPTSAAAGAAAPSKADARREGGGSQKAGGTRDAAGTVAAGGVVEGAGVPEGGGRLERGPAYGEISDSGSRIANLKSQISYARSQIADRGSQTADGARGEGRPTYGQDWPTYRHDGGRTGRTGAAVPARLAPAWTARIGGRLSGITVADGVLLVASVDAHTIHALDARTGRPLWRHTVGGRVDSPPTIHRKTAVFGSADGYVYCLRLTDGATVWRFRAAPVDRRTVAFDQVESVWPVTGSVLVRPSAGGPDVVYCTAGRSSYLDGGMVMYRLDAATGRPLGSTTFASRDPKTGREPEALIEDVELPGTLPDVLVDDGTYLYLRDKRMLPDGTEQPPTVAHLYSSVGLLDGAWWHRGYWSWGQRNWGRASGWHVAAAFRPSGRVLIADEKTVFGYGRKRVTYGGSSLTGYHLFRADKQVTPIKGKGGKLTNNNQALVRHLSAAKVTYHWSRAVPIVARAMVLTKDALFAAGPVATADGAEPSFDAPGPAALMAFAPADGRDLATCKLDDQPVFDGMAAARGRLYLATRDGRVVCLAGE